MLIDYLKIATAQDLNDPRERRFFRFLEILPGAASWLTIILAVVLSWKAPFFMATFILVFDLYWLVRSIYFSFYLRLSYVKIGQAMKTDWQAKLKTLPGHDDIYHLCLFTLCHEPYSVVKAAFESLVKSDYSKEKMIVVLSAEEKYRQFTQEAVEKIGKEFANVFFRFLITWHPSNLLGEIPGKGSNDRWAEIRAKEEIIDPLAIPYEKVIVSFFDVDSCVFPKHFSCLAWHYLTVTDPTKTSFQPVPFFINNLWESPPLTGILAFSSTLWPTINQGLPERLITFSSHAMSFKALAEIGFKRSNVVSDDSRVFWQSFLKYHGDYRVEPLFYPLPMDANVVQTSLKTFKNIYLQQRRWAYGAGEVPYVFYNFLKDKQISFKTKISWGLFILQSHWSWATSAILIFLLGWLPVVLGGQIFGGTLIGHTLPLFASRLMRLAMVGLVGFIYFYFAILPPKPKNVSRFKYLVFVVEWLILPFTMILFWSLPAIDAQTRLMLGKYMGFWPTEKHRS
jgi:hypothetical protein